MPGDQKQLPDAAARQGPTTEAVNAGLDIEVPWTLHYDVDTLTNSSAVDPSLIDEAAKRILTQKFRFNSATGTDAGASRRHHAAKILARVRCGLDRRDQRGRHGPRRH